MSRYTEQSSSSINSSDNEDSNQFSGGINVGKSFSGEEFISAFSRKFIPGDGERRRRKRPRSSSNQRLKRIHTDEAVVSESITGHHRLGGKRTMQQHWRGDSSFSGRHGRTSANSSEEVNIKAASFDYRQEKFITSEESSEESAGSPARKFLRCFEIDLDFEHIQSSDGEAEVRGSTGEDQEEFVIEVGVHESDIIVEDSVEIGGAQTESERMRRFIMECVQNHPVRFKVIHDVFTIQNIRYSDRYISRICEHGGNSGRSFKGTIFFVTIHANDHLHVVHDCAYNGNSCRCQRVKEIRAECGQPRLNRRLLRAAECTSEHWLNLAVYFETGERQAVHFEIAGRMWTKCGKTRDLSIRQNQRLRQKKLRWKHAETKMLFLTTSNVDPLQMEPNKIQNMALKEISKIKGIQKETKEINYWNSFGGFQHR